MSRPPIYASLFEKLFANSVILPWCGCYIWMGQSSHGYGRLSTRDNTGKHLNKRVHRTAYEEYYKIKLPSGKEHPLRHTCNISFCWRPEHLILGTIKQNVHDTIRNGAHISGWRNYNERRKQEKHIRSIIKENK